MNATTRRDMLRRLDTDLAAVKRPDDLPAVLVRFFANHAGYEPFKPAIEELYDAHKRRAGGLGSPADCDAVTAKVIG